MTTTVEVVFDAFKELLWDSLVQTALSKLFQRFTFLSWGPIASLLTWIVMKYSEEFYQAIKLFIEVELLIFKNKELQKAYGISSVELKRIALNQGIESPEFRKARDENKKRLEPFVRYHAARSS